MAETPSLAGLLAAATAGLIGRPEPRRVIHKDTNRTTMQAIESKTNVLRVFGVCWGMKRWLIYTTMKYTSWLVFLLSLCPACAQEPVRLSLTQAIALAASPRGPASVQLADAAVGAAHARVAEARSYRFPLLTGNISESNLTRNLGAEGFNFPTGVPNFKIPSEVGPFNVFDGRVEMTQTVFDLGAIRRSRAIRAALDVEMAGAAGTRESASARAAHDYLLALAAEARMRCAEADVQQTDANVTTAHHDIEAGKASDAELTHALLNLSASRRKLGAAQNAATQARLQLLDDLGLEFDTTLEFTDVLNFDSNAGVDLAAQISLALRTRAELRAAAGRLEEARDQSGADRAAILPTVSAYGDVGPQNSVITHTVGVSAKITLFDGGRRKAQEAQSNAAVQQFAIQQHDLKRQIEMEVRRAFANLQTASSRAHECEAALGLSQEGLARAQRRFANGLGDNAEMVSAELQEVDAREEQVEAYLAWNQARLELAQATGTVDAFEMKSK